ncbi:ABC transporter ATP-binding protein [Halobacteriovorax sp. HLS]|uniref:ABC transporter ATP-binding protein n=1 Tax=Halobacteriovorax sp. HLS TaxID=2234000 RepID=UPI000FDAA57E|nr:ABC transporter ATP-binding protein [Halobacteriovorax sp. HLS]
MTTFSRRYKFLSEYKTDFLVSLVLGILISVLEVFSITLVMPLLGESEGSSSLIYFFNRYLETYSDRERIALIAILIVVFTLLKSVFIYVKSLIAAKLRTSVTATYQKKCFKQIIDMPIAEFKKLKRGDLQILTTIHTNNMGIVAGKLLASLHYPFIVVLTTALLLKISISLTFLSLFATGLLFIGLKYLNVAADRRARLVSPSHKRLGVALLEYLDGKKTIFLFDIGDYVRGLFDSKVENYRDKVIDMEKLRGVVMPLGGFVTSLSLAIILIGSLYFGNIQKSVLLLFLVAFSRLSAPVNALVQLRSSLSGDLPYLDEVHTFLDKDFGVSDTSEKNKLLLNDSIKLRDISFKYPGSDSFLFNGLNLSINKGEKVTIVGGSGSGKSTLVNILLGIEKPSDGDVVVDGEALTEELFIEWRKNIGVVSQDVFLFDDTILGNITLEEKGQLTEWILKVSSQASLDDFVNDNEAGFNHFVGENGGDLSGGQRQRISIARALYRDPEIVIFDEATSALDIKTEAEIQLTMNKLSKSFSKTLIYVTHRLSSIESDERVIVLEKGKIVEDGLRSELENKRGWFFNLLNRELSGK